MSSGACSVHPSSSTLASGSPGTKISQAAFKRIEDAAVDDAVRLQEAAGLAVLTDGEMRRLSFQSQLTESVDGFSEWDIDAFLWGRWRSDELGDMEIERPPIAVVDTLRRKRFLSAEEFTYTRGEPTGS